MTYPFEDIACEFCDRTQTTYEAAIDEGWKVGWDGWVCPYCMEEKQEVLH